LLKPVETEHRSADVSSISQKKKQLEIVNISWPGERVRKRGAAFETEYA